jgi:hypothetical protein
VTFTGSDFFRVVGGKIAEQWADLDALGLMQQLGAIPPMGEQGCMAVGSACEAQQMVELVLHGILNTPIEGSET